MATTGSGIRSRYRGDLERLRELVLEMATFVEDMLRKAMDSLVNRDADLAEEVRRSDDVADDLDFSIEELGIKLLALQQPMARDLREIASCLKIATDLERVGDYARDIAKIARRFKDEPYYWPLEDIPVMGDKARGLVRSATRAFLDANISLAHDVLRQDEELDDLWRKLRDQLISHMQSDPRYVFQATHLLFVARYLERIGDHTTNVAERVIYIETGTLPRAQELSDF